MDAEEKPLIEHLARDIGPQRADGGDIRHGIQALALGQVVGEDARVAEDGPGETVGLAVLRGPAGKEAEHALAGFFGRGADVQPEGLRGRQVADLHLVGDGFERRVEILRRHHVLQGFAVVRKVPVHIIRHDEDRIRDELRAMFARAEEDHGAAREALHRRGPALVVLLADAVEEPVAEHERVGVHERRVVGMELHGRGGEQEARAVGDGIRERLHQPRGRFVLAPEDQRSRDRLRVRGRQAAPGLPEKFAPVHLDVPRAAGGRVRLVLQAGMDELHEAEALPRLRPRREGQEQKREQKGPESVHSVVSGNCPAWGAS